MNKPVCFNQPILETSKIVRFGMIIGNQNMEKKKKRNYIAWIQTAL